MNTHDYIISGGHEGKKRLNVLSDVLHTYTKELLERHGVGTGSSFLDLGSGGGNVAAMVAKMTGEHGSVTAVDFDQEISSLARQDAMEEGLSNISFIVQSAYDIGYENEFDVAYARFLLSHLDKPHDVLHRMVQGVKPGGKIIVEDIEFSGHFCYPVCPAFYSYLDYYKRAATHKGANADIGPSLVSLFRMAGIKDVGFDVIQPSFNTGPGKWMAYITLDKIKATLAEHKIVDMTTVGNVLAELELFTKDEETTISLPRIFRVWGIKK